MSPTQAKLTRIAIVLGVVTFVVLPLAVPGLALLAWRSRGTIRP